jgi:hypothetical protein
MAQELDGPHAILQSSWPWQHGRYCKNLFSALVKLDQRIASSVKTAEEKSVSGSQLSLSVVDNVNFQFFVETMIEVVAKYGSIRTACKKSKKSLNSGVIMLFRIVILE